MRVDAQRHVCLLWRLWAAGAPALPPSTHLLAFLLHCGAAAEKIPGTDWQEVTCDDGKKYWWVPAADLGVNAACQPEGEWAAAFSCLTCTMHPLRHCPPHSFTCHVLNPAIPGSTTNPGPPGTTPRARRQRGTSLQRWRRRPHCAWTPSKPRCWSAPRPWAHRWHPSMRQVRPHSEAGCCLVAVSALHPPCT